MPKPLWVSPVASLAVRFRFIPTCALIPERLRTGVTGPFQEVSPWEVRWSGGESGKT